MSPHAPYCSASCRAPKRPAGQVAEEVDRLLTEADNGEERGAGGGPVAATRGGGGAGANPAMRLIDEVIRRAADKQGVPVLRPPP